LSKLLQSLLKFKYFGWFIIWFFWYTLKKKLIHINSLFLIHAIHGKKVKTFFRRRFFNQILVFLIHFDTLKRSYYSFYILVNQPNIMHLARVGKTPVFFIWYTFKKNKEIDTRDTQECISFFYRLFISQHKLYQFIKQRKTMFVTR